MRSHLKVIKQLTGSEPPTCPWRAMYHGLVKEVLAAMAFEENGNLALAIGADPPRMLLDAITVYRVSLAAVRAEDEKLRMEKFKWEREARR